MKKVCSLILVFVLSLLLCACGKSEAAENAERLISSIGEVSLESKNALDAAQCAFDALSEEDKKQVENYYILVEGQAVYKELEEQNALEEQSDLGKKTYESIKTAWEITERIGADIYNIWYGSIWTRDDLDAKGIQFFVDETELSEKEIIEGLASYSFLADYGDEGVTWEELPENNRQLYRDHVVGLFAQYSPEWRTALLSTVFAYKLNGMAYAAQTELESAKSDLKALTEQYTDFEYTSPLRDFYTMTSSFFDFCMSPTGSFEQYKVLLSDYRKEAREHISNFAFVFE